MCRYPLWDFPWTVVRTDCLSVGGSTYYQAIRGDTKTVPWLPFEGRKFFEGRKHEGMKLSKIWKLIWLTNYVWTWSNLDSKGMDWMHKKKYFEFIDFFQKFSKSKILKICQKYQNIINITNNFYYNDLTHVQ